MFSLLKPTVSLVLRPHMLALMLLPTTRRSPTNLKQIPRFRYHILAPYIFGAESLDQ
jgi:hypothetical protein